MLEGDDLQRTISLSVGKRSVLVSKLCDCMILFSLLDERFFGSCSLYYIYTHNCGTNNYISINFRQYLIKSL